MASLSLRPSAPPILSDAQFTRPRIQAWIEPVNEPPPPYQSPVPFLGQNVVPLYSSPREPNNPSQVNIVRLEHRRETRGPRVKWHQIKFKKQYLLSKFAAMKALEFVSCSIAFSACFAFRKNFGIGFMSGDRSGFFILLHLISWILVIALFWTSLIGYMKEVSNPAQFVKMMIIHVSLGFLILISSALLSDAPFTGLCSVTTTACLTFKIAVGFGFFAVILFWLDALLHYHAFKQSILLV